jgi:spermidine/putrescine transport system ATP-binding protein
MMFGPDSEARRMFDRFRGSQRSETAPAADGPADPPPDVAVRGVVKRFGETVAVAGVDLDIQQGEFVTLLGPSGCGKTTLLRIIAGLEQATSGRIDIRGRSMRGVPPYRRPVSLVFQNLALFPHMDVYRNVAFGPEMARADAKTTRRRVAEYLELVDLGGYEQRQVSQLSGGQRQRVALARALIREPTVLLLDEPLAALDLKLRRQMQIELKRIQEKLGATFIYVTHDQEEALVMSDRIAVMNGGLVEQYGRAEEVYRSPKTSFVASFIGDTNLLEGTVTRVADGKVTVDCGVTCTARVPTGHQVEAGASVHLSVRPEHIRVGQVDDEDAAAMNCFTGKVLERHFRGPSLRLVVEGPAATRMIAELADEDAEDDYPVGTPVRLAWRWQHVALVP